MTDPITHPQPSRPPADALRSSTAMLYEKPRVTTLGTLAELTLGGSLGDNTDGFGASSLSATAG
jgi:hypothetical protein